MSINTDNLFDDPTEPLPAELQQYLEEINAGYFESQPPPSPPRTGPEPVTTPHRSPTTEPTPVASPTPTTASTATEPRFPRNARQPRPKRVRKSIVVAATLLMTFGAVYWLLPAADSPPPTAAAPPNLLSLPRPQPRPRTSPFLAWTVQQTEVHAKRDSQTNAPRWRLKNQATAHPQFVGTTSSQQLDAAAVISDLPTSEQGTKLRRFLDTIFQALRGLVD